MSKDSASADGSEASDVSFDISEYEWVKKKVCDTVSLYNSPDSMDEVLQTLKFTNGQDGLMVVSSCHPDEPFCWGKSALSREDFFFVYAPVMRKLRIRLPFSPFICSVLTYLRVAPSQLSPNGWAFVRAFEVLCHYHNVNPTRRLLLYFFQAKNNHSSGVGWVSLSSISERPLLYPYTQSFRYFADRFFKIVIPDNFQELALDEEGRHKFPLYWRKKPRSTSKMSDGELSPDERVAVELLQSLPPANCWELISLESRPTVLKQFLGNIVA